MPDRDVFKEAFRSRKRGKPPIYPGSFHVMCSGRRHRVEIDSKGRLLFPDHPIEQMRKEMKEAGPQVLEKLGMRYGCLKILHSWPKAFSYAWWDRSTWLPRPAWRMQAVLANRNGRRNGDDNWNPALYPFRERWRQMTQKALSNLVGKAKKCVLRLHIFRGDFMEVDFRDKPGMTGGFHGYEFGIRIWVRPGWLLKVYRRRIAGMFPGRVVLDIVSGDGRKPGSVLLVGDVTPEVAKAWNQGRGRGEEAEGESFRVYEARITGEKETITVTKPDGTTCEKKIPQLLPL